MKRFIIYGAAGLLFIGLATYGGGVSHAWFTDRDAVETESQMAAVDIELARQSFTDGTASFTINNNSNIDVYLRAGLIFEARTQVTDGEWVIVDMSDIGVEPADGEWKAVQKTLAEEDGYEYQKWFLEYAGAGGYTPVSSDTKQLGGTFYVTGAPEGYELVVYIVPEAIQADIDGQALVYLQDPAHVKPTW